MADGPIGDQDPSAGVTTEERSTARTVLAALRGRLLATRARMRSTPAGRATFRLLIALLGALVVVVGLVLVPLPGPGWFIVFGGLAIWAIEFVWARHLLRFARRTVQRWRVWLSRQHLAVRLPVIALLVAVVLTIAWLSARQLGFDPAERFFG